MKKVPIVSPALLTLFYPQAGTCALCNERRNAIEGWGICAECASQMPQAQIKHACPVCGRSFVRHGVCNFCRDWPGALFGARAAFVYEYATRDMVRAMKYRRLRPLATMLSLRMANVARREILPRFVAQAVAYVPMDRVRRFQRGFDHAKILAEYVGEALNLPTENALIRTRYTAPQSGLPFSERPANVRNAFAPREVRPVKYLLIDDISTSGATLRECAEALLLGGATGVFALTAAMVRD